MRKRPSFFGRSGLWQVPIEKHTRSIRDPESDVYGAEQQTAARITVSPIPRHIDGANATLLTPRCGSSRARSRGNRVRAGWNFCDIACNVVSFGVPCSGVACGVSRALIGRSGVAAGSPGFPRGLARAVQELIGRSGGSAWSPGFPGVWLSRFKR